MCKNIQTLYINFEQFKASKIMFLMILILGYIKTRQAKHVLYFFSIEVYIFFCSS